MRARLRSVPWGAWALVLLVFGIVTYSVFSSAAAFLPDSRYYAAMSLRITGLSAQESYEQVKVFVDQFGWATPGPDALFGWGLVAPRIMLPLLSAPFVAVFGIPGLQVVPVVAMGVGLLVTLTVGGRTRAGVAATLAAVLLLESSRRMILYGGAMLTESLAFALVAGLALCLPWDGRPRSRRSLVVALALLTLLAFTRQATLIPAGAVVVAWLGSAVRERRIRTSWTPYALWLSVATVGLQVAQTVVFPGFNQLNQFLAATHAKSLLGALRNTPGLARHIISTDLHQMARTDIPLLVLLVLAIVAGVVRWRHTDAHLLIGAVLGTMLYNVTNGTPTMFRYGFPGLVFVVVAVALLVRSVAEKHLVPVSAVDPDPTEPEVDDGVDDDADRLRHDKADAERGQ